MISPARLPLYSALAEHFDLLLSQGGTEHNRGSWNDMEKALRGAKVQRAWGWQTSQILEKGGTFVDRRYIHITPGHIWHLIRFRPDVIVTNEMGLRTFIALTYGTLFRKPVWVWWGGTLYTERKITFMRRGLRRVISRWARHWISYGRTSTEYLQSLGIENANILELQNTVDDQKFLTGVEPLFHIQPRPVLLCVGQLVARKGVDLLLEAAATVQKEGRDFSLVFVGGGPDEQIFRLLAQVLELKNTYFYPEQSPEKLPSVYRSGDVLVFPTREDVWGLVTNEAVLSGLPVLCSRYAGSALELFPPENIFDPEKPEEFKSKLRAALDGKLAAPDKSRIKSTTQLAAELIQAIEQSVNQSGRSLRDASEEGLS